MTYKNLPKYIYSLALALTLLTAFGIANTTQAQNRDWDRNQDQDRWEDRREQRERQRRDRDYEPNGGYRDNGNYGGYGNNGGRYGGFYTRDEEKGFKDGLRRGQEDAQSRRIPDPNNSSHYRKGNSDYRNGFRQGYKRSYFQHAPSRNRW